MSLASLYPWLKAFHVAAAFAFVSGVMLEGILLWGLSKDEERSKAFAPLVVHWNHMATTPAMFALWAFGLSLAIVGQWGTAPWFIIKMGLVIAISGLHATQSGKLRRASAGGDLHAMRTAPWILATVLGISILAVVKPMI